MALQYFMLINTFFGYTLVYRFIKVWEELQIAMVELPPARCKTRKLHRRRRAYDHQIA